ncbi:MAG: serine/threonine-protein phosphatase [Kineosporiaceae bacterium]|nr:serine/threonine-protein phosphatase [Aeromicrobium sp.]
MSEPRGETALGNLDVAPAQALEALHADARLAAPYELAGLIDRCARTMGARGAIAYLADLRQQVLVPFVGPSELGDGAKPASLDVESTLAGRAFQTFETHIQEADIDGTCVWLPLLVGTERFGVLGVTIIDSAALEDGLLSALLARLASLTAELLSAKTLYGDTLVRLRRRREMSLAAEIQWSLLPPLTVATSAVAVAAVLEPAYQVAGDTIDYAVDAGITHVAVFDGMGHGLQSAQCAVLAVASYRNSRRAGLSLVETMHGIDEALLTGLGDEVFSTAVLAQLDTDSGLLRWVNGGHHEPLLLRDGKFVKTLHLDPRPPLGLGYLRDSQPVPVGNEQLEPGDQILLYTDGVVDARSPNGESFGIDRLAELVIRHLAGGLAAPETMRRVVRELFAHQQGPLVDDASLLLLQWHGRTT